MPAFAQAAKKTEPAVAQAATDAAARGSAGSAATPSKGGLLDQQAGAPAKAQDANGFGLQLASLAEAGDKAPEWEGSDSGLKNYEKSLGKLLGGELYKAVSKEVTLSKMSKHAESAWHGALKSLAGAFGDAGDLSEADIDRVAAAMTAEFGDIASDWVEGEGAGLVSALQGWVDASPVKIATIALLAAAGAVAANVDLPELKAKVGVAQGLSASMAVSLGKVRDISLQKIEGALTYQTSTLKAAAVLEWDPDKGSAAKLGVRWEDQFAGGTLGLRGDARWSEDEGSRFGVGADWRKGDFSIGLEGSVSDRGDKSVGLGVKWRF